MNINKFTQKSMEAVQNCEKIASDYGNQEIEQEHLLYSLLTLDDSLIAKMIEKMEIDPQTFLNRVEELIEKRPKVQGGQPYVGQYLNKVLISAEDEMKVFGDEYVSVEHLFLAMIKHPSSTIKNLFREFGITRERFLQALSTVRGNQRVVSDNPEATYDTLNKYGEDLVEKARNQKLDPVIGRDAEIRNIIRSEDGIGHIQDNDYAAPIISHRADPYIYKHTDGKYYFLGSHTDAGHNLNGTYQYLYIILRCADTLEDLTDNSGRYTEKVIYEREPIGPDRVSPHLWAPEIHYIQGGWYVYYTTTVSDHSSWRIRPHCLACTGDNDLHAFALGALRILEKCIRLSVSGNDRHFKINTKLFQYLGSLCHDRHIRVTAHYNSNFCHCFFSL